MLSLTSIDLSYNQLEGALPNTKAFHDAPIEAFRNNKGLCGNATGLKTCPSTVSHNHHVKKRNKVMKLILVLSGVVFLIFIVVGITSFVRSRKTKTETKPKEAELQNMFTVWSYDGKMVYENIIEATEDFDDKHCIGVGGSGIVYKAEMLTGQVVAVKKLRPFLEDGVVNLKSFTSEIRSLTEIRHRNIVRLHGFCSHPRHSLLVYEFLEGGSLEKILKSDELAIDFNWVKRVNVVKGVASALSYMHHDCSHPIIHRDISSKNVLLDSEYEAHVSDFGTARIMSSDKSFWTSFAGTFGYTAPGIDALDSLPCLLFLVCLRDTFVPEGRKLRDPRRLYAPGRMYHIVERKFCRCGRFPPEVRTAIPVDGRFEHIVLSCNATSDHGIVWIERESEKALQRMKESSSETVTAAPRVQKIERRTSQENEPEPSESQNEDDSKTKSQSNSGRTNWDEVVEKLFKKDESGELLLMRDTNAPQLQQ
uniref:non-specific serine/threonine protein kinase n=1 Tax=Fagus sylvatica TaxID=28930 RepID=A0A2N9FS51_FAGSY